MGSLFVGARLRDVGCRLPDVELRVVGVLAVGVGIVVRDVGVIVAEAEGSFSHLDRCRSVLGSLYGIFYKGKQAIKRRL